MMATLLSPKDANKPISFLRLFKSKLTIKIVNKIDTTKENLNKMSEFKDKVSKLPAKP